ncbi:MAG TPA: DUF309 domain-containing protein [Candidatus Thermoplasmatota archaeon]|nr:DUF309 domain-containing protein [Candidatus Thermoplasmatota archaeon]
MTGPLNTSRNRNTPPIHAPWEHPALDEGLLLFNQGEHWHAHEALEPLWMGLEGDDKLFVQGIIMAAAMLVQYGRKVPRGVANHWANVTLRLRPHEPSRWGIDVSGLLHQLRPYAEAAAQGAWDLQAGAVRIDRKP